MKRPMKFTYRDTTSGSYSFKNDTRKVVFSYVAGGIASPDRALIAADNAFKEKFSRHPKEVHNLSLRISFVNLCNRTPPQWGGAKVW